MPVLSRTQLALLAGEAMPTSLGAHLFPRILASLPSPPARDLLMEGGSLGIPPFGGGLAPLLMPDEATTLSAAYFKVIDRNGPFVLSRAYI